MNPNMVVRYFLRPHHFLCVLGYQGKGYDDAFTANMTRIVDALRQEPEGIVLSVAGGIDDLCTPCPHNQGTQCANQSKINQLDHRHQQALHLNIGQELCWEDAKKRILRYVQPDMLAHLCEGCQWLQSGMCQQALETLHDQESR